MAVRSPNALKQAEPDPLKRALDYEAAAEIAASLGAAGRKAEARLARLGTLSPDDPDRGAALASAARAVHAYFIQRELIGLRRHDAVIAQMGIPRAVLARLGVS